MWFPWDTASIAAQNLQQTLLADDADHPHRRSRVAFAFRCGMFNIGGQGQYFAGTIFAVWLGSSFAGLSPCAARAALPRRRHARRRGVGGHRRHPQGDRRRPRGDLDDHAQLDRDLGRLVPLRPGRAAAGLAQASIPISNDIVEGAKLPVFWGLEAPAGALDRDLHRARDARRLLDHHQPDDARLRGARRRLQPGGGALRRHLGRAQLLPRDGDLRRVRRARGRRRHHRLGVPDRPERHPRRTRSASSASPPRCSGATPPLGVGLRVAALRRADQRHLRAPARPVDLPARPRRQPDDDHPGPRHPLRRPQPRRRVASGCKRRRRA